MLTSLPTDNLLFNGFPGFFLFKISSDVSKYLILNFLKLKALGLTVQTLASPKVKKRCEYLMVLNMWVVNIFTLNIQNYQDNSSLL